MPKFTVRVDDPNMASEHVIEVDAEDEGTARSEAAKRAILADRRGAGAGCPVDYGTFVMPTRKREKQAQDPTLVETVAAFSTASAA